LTIEHVERKNFRQEDRVAEVLQKRGDAPGLARAFYALGDVKTPMRISLFCFAVNLIFAVALVRPLRQGGLGIANTVTSLCNVGLLFYALRRKLGKLGMESLRATLLPLAGAGILAGLAAWWGCRLWENTIGHAALFQKVGAVFVPAAAAGLIYFLATVALKIPAAKEMADLVFQIFRGQQQQ
jgi:putative peptidoglycan lipid II flippase